MYKYAGKAVIRSRSQFEYVQVNYSLSLRFLILWVEMKAFIAITLLAACAAAQTFDHQAGRQLLKREHGLFKDIYGIGKAFDYDTLRKVNTYPYTIPTSYNTINDVDTLTLEELIQHPLFQTYYTLPLFRQHFNHPLFRLYLTTPHFQKYWNQPIFTTFFRNPYLFNKYIYPIVYNTVTGVYDRDSGLDTKNIFGNYKTYTQTIPFETTYGNKYTNVVYPFNTGYPVNRNHVQYANIIDKIIKTILVNKPEITHVNFNLPTPIEKRTFDKIVDPITGEIKYTINIDDFKTGGKKITPVDKTVEQEVIKNAILKKIILNKFIYGDRKIGQTIPEIFNTNKYETIYPREHISQYEITIPRELINKFETIPSDILAKYTIPTELVSKFEKIPREHISQHDTPIPREHISQHETTIPREHISHYETSIPREVITKFDNIPRDLLAKYTIPTEITKKFEKKTTPLGFVNRFAIIPREQQLVKTKYETIPREYITKDEKINNIETIIPNEIEVTKKIETETDNILKPEETIETETATRR